MKLLLGPSLVTAIRPESLLASHPNDALRAHRNALIAEEQLQPVSLVDATAETTSTSLFATSNPDDAMKIVKRHGHARADEREAMQKSMKELENVPHQVQSDINEMDNEQVLNKLKGLNAQTRQAVQTVLKQKPDTAEGSSPASGEEELSEGEMMEKAIGALNDMFLTTDEERVVEATNCKEDLKALHNQLWTHGRQKSMLETDGTDFMDKKITASAEYEQKLSEIQDQVDFIGGLRAEHAMAMNKETSILKDMEDQVNLYAFITGEVEEGCVDPEGGNKTEEAFFQKKGHGKVCVKGNGVSGALTSIFSQPKVQAKVKLLSETARRDLEGHFAEMDSGATDVQGADEDLEQSQEEEDAMVVKKPALLQMQMQQEPLCGPQTTDCDDLLSIVGQELACKKKDVLVQNEVIAELKEKQDAEDARANRGLVLLKKTLESIGDRIAHFANGIRETEIQIEEQDTLYRDLYKSSREMYHRCEMRIVELETNYCGVKKLREFMKERAVKKGHVKPEDIVDCDFDEYMVPDPECIKDGKQVDCMSGNVVPSSPNDLPQRIWRREIRGEPNNNTYALPCPPRRSMKRACNAFLCPVNCKVGEWQPWSTCTADCNGGAMTHIRKIETTPRYGGAKCPPTTGREECNSNPCDKDCVLHRYWWPKSRCLQSCGDDRVRLVSKWVWEAAIGNGGCPDKESDERLKTERCSRHRCLNDEVCTDMMDLAIVYECSASTTKMGCYFISEFVKQLMSKMASHIFEFQAMKVSLIKFGNGKAVRDPISGKYATAPAELVSPLTGDIAGLRQLVSDDAMLLYGDNPKWHLGFNNAAQGLTLAAEVLGESVRSGRPFYAQKKVLLITKGKRTECTTLMRTSAAMQDDGIDVSAVLLASDYKDTPESKKRYEPVVEAVSYPDDVHFNLIEGVALLADTIKRESYVDKIIPRVCPRALSPLRYRWRARYTGVALVHYGRTCNSWTSPYSSESIVLSNSSVRNPSECGQLAEAAGYTGFIYTWQSWWERRMGKNPNCFTHATEGKTEQVDDTGSARDDTCKCKTFECTGKVAGAKGGWLDQTITGYRYWRPTSHYRVYHYGDTSEHKIHGIFRFDGGEGTSSTKAEEDGDAEEEK